MKPESWLMLAVMFGVGGAALFSMWLAGRLVYYAVTAPVWPALNEGRAGSERAAKPKQWRAGKRDSQILTIRAASPDGHSAARGGYIRYVARQ